MDEVYWIWLQSVLGAASRAAGAVLEQGISPYEIFQMNNAQRRAKNIFTWLQLEKMQATSLRHAQEVYQNCMEVGYHILTPRRVEYPELLRHIASPPLVLYAQGELSVLNTPLPIGMVGARKMSVYGGRAAEDLSRGLAMQGFTIVSGLAVGIDAQCHQGALDGGGKTVAVIGCGLDIAYPSANQELRYQIAKNGLVISEYPPGTPAVGHHFPIRNRIISGLSLGVIVVEAGRHSGSLITAGHALTQGRDVFAVPTDIYDPHGAGALHLIKQGAKLITCPLDVVEEYFWIYQDKLSEVPFPLNPAPVEQLTLLEPEENPKDKPKEDPKGREERKKRRYDFPDYLTKEQQQVLELLSAKPQHVELLLPKTELTMYELLSIMTELEIYGLVKAYPGKQFSL